MNKVVLLPNALKTIPTRLLWAEIAKRLKLNFGQVQMTFHGGEPSRFAVITQSVSSDQDAD